MITPYDAAEICREVGRRQRISREMMAEGVFDEVLPKTAELERLASEPTLLVSALETIGPEAMTAEMRKYIDRWPTSGDEDREEAARLLYDWECANLVVVVAMKWRNALSAEKQDELEKIERSLAAIREMALATASAFRPVLGWILEYCCEWVVVEEGHIMPDLACALMHTIPPP